MSDMIHAQSIKRGFCMIRSQATADVLPVIKAGPVRASHVEKGFSNSPGLRKTLGRCGRQGGGKVPQKGRRRQGRWTFLSQALQGRCVGRRRGRGGRGLHLMGALQMEPVKPAQNTRKVASSTDPGARSGAFTTSIMLGTLSTTHTAAGGKAPRRQTGRPAARRSRGVPSLHIVPRTNAISAACSDGGRSSCTPLMLWGPVGDTSHAK